MEEYALTVTEVLHQICKQAHIPMPHLMTESGRALTAHHAILLTNVIDSEHVTDVLTPANTHTTPAVKPCNATTDSTGKQIASTESISDSPNGETKTAKAHPILLQLTKLSDRCQGPLSHRDSLTCYHQLRGALDQCQQLFQAGTLDLRTKSEAEQHFYLGCSRLQPLLDVSNRAHRPVIEELNELLSHRLFLNFSLFQSTPDVWGIGQIFPIMPVTDLHNSQYTRAKLSDLTCDSDGRIDNYVDGMGVEQTLPLPTPCVQKGAVLGFFLVGAYQEILGDLHNLFGDTNSVDVTLTGPNTYTVSNLKTGDTAESVLKTVNFEGSQLHAALEEKIMGSALPQTEKIAILKHFQRVISSSTYLR
jgi:arginine decarboxylase